MDPWEEEARRQARAQVDTTGTIVAQAGLGKSARRRKVSLAFLVSMLVLVVLGAGGVLALRVLSDPAGGFSPSGDSSAIDSSSDTPSGPREALTPEEIARLRQVFGEDGTPYLGRRRSNRKSARERRLQAFYEKDEKDEVVPVGPRHRPGIAAAADMDLGTGGATAAPGAMAKTEVMPIAPSGASGPGCLADDQVLAVVRKHQKRVRRRLERLASRGTSWRGKIKLRARVQPDGRVEWVRLDTPKFQGTPIEDFLVRDVKLWRFPVFAGQACELSIPLILSARQAE